MDKTNNLFLGLNDMEIIQKLDVPFLESKDYIIQEFDLLIIDNNLNKEALEYLLITYQNKIIIMDAVSAVKAQKLKHLLSNINLLKVNKLELEALTGQSDIADPAQPSFYWHLCKYNGPLWSDRSYSEYSLPGQMIIPEWIRRRHK